MAIQFTGMASGLDTSSIISDLMKVERTKSEKITKQKTLVEWKKDAWKAMNSKLYSFYKTELFNFKSASTYNKKSLTSSNTSAVAINSSPNGIKGSHDIEVTAVAKGSFLTGASLGSTVTSSTTMGELVSFAEGETKTLQVKLADSEEYKEISISASDTVSSTITKLNGLGIDMNASFDNNFKRVFLSTKDTGADAHITVNGDDSLLTALGFGSSNRVGTAGQDAAFIYNGTSLTSASNEISVNGLSLSIKGIGSSTISVAQDTEAIYQSVKSFITKYNELITEINEKTGAASAKDYDPLTSEEKEAMAEDEVKLWEDKIKSSLFRNDQKLGDLGDILRNTLTTNSGVSTSGFDFTSLSTLGIVTGNYTEKGLLHIEGDEDEALLGGKTNKLRNAIEENPDGVMELMTALGNKIYTEFGNKMRSSSLNSALTFYNDKQLDNQLKDYEEKLALLEDRYDAIESRYSKQFTAMEQAIQQSNSTSSWLSQQLGSFQ